MEKYGFLSRFSRHVLSDTESIDETAHLMQDDPAVRDLRSLLWSSIDNIDSQDLDQLEYCERRSNREICVMVAIADVDALVPKGSSIDRHAAKNGTSVYTGVEIFPMLPERLSTKLTSLIENEDRLAVVIEYFVLKDGSVRSGDIYRAIVRNKAKLVYEEVGAWLEGEGPLPDKVVNLQDLEGQLHLQDEAAQRLHNFRRDNGALELDTIEAKPVIQDNAVVDLIVRHKNRAHFLIENFMVAANGTMARFLEKKGSPLIQRVVRTPERWAKIVEVAASLGRDLPLEPDPVELSDFLIQERQNDPLRFPDLSLTIVKLMGSGEYVLFAPGEYKLGHFGLAVQDYTHSTAPNRRYVDLVMQRLVKGVLNKDFPSYSRGELMQVAEWCTDRDQASKKVERFMRKVAAALLLMGRVGETFEAIVTGASYKGTYVRLMDPPAEGRVVRGEIGMEIGEKVQVRLIGLQIDKGFIDFEGFRAARPKQPAHERRHDRPPKGRKPFYKFKKKRRR